MTVDKMEVDETRVGKKVVDKMRINQLISLSLSYSSKRRKGIVCSLLESCCVDHRV